MLVSILIVLVLVVLNGFFAMSELAIVSARKQRLQAILRADAKIAHSGRRQATCTCELTTLDDAGTPTLCAIAQGTVIAR